MFFWTVKVKSNISGYGGGSCGGSRNRGQTGEASHFACRWTNAVEKIECDSASTNMKIS